MPQKLSNTLKVFALLLLSLRCEAQEFEWANFFQGKGNQWAVSLSADPSGNQYSTFNYDFEIKFGSNYIKDSTTPWKCLVLKQNKDGKVLWYKTVKAVNKIYGVAGLASRFNSKGNLVFFISSPADIIVGTDTVKGKVSGVSLIEFDQNGKIVNHRSLIEGTPIQQTYVSNVIVSDEHDNFYLSLIYKGQVKIYDSTGLSNYGSSSSKERNIIFKFSRSAQKFEWATELPYNSFWANSLKVDIHGNVYLGTFWSGTTTSFTFKGKTINNPQTSIGALFIWDKNGKDKNWFYIEASGKKSTITGIAVHDSNSIFISGSYLGDSAKFDTFWKGNTKYGWYQFFARYNISGKVKWVKTEDTSYSVGFSGHYGYGSMTNYKDKYFYCSFNLNNTYPIIYDGQKYVPAKNNEHGMHIKIDDRGNILWGFITILPFMSMATDEDNNLFFQGWWSSDSIRFGNYKANPVNTDSYIGKTFDYAIYRGDVNSGPFCAGDSLFVPFTKFGEFADTNIFFAEISDEFGNFTGKEREIGRLKSKNDGTIRGVLPMFKVASSGNYRIRIRSTSPQAQSFYKVDTLRLLIYSRDKADPGPPEWICSGDTLQLNTYGGTKWKWSPKYRMNDSTLRQPMVWPIKDTIYKIIISDSSGCGAPDTAYKKIVLRKPLKLTLAFNDTTVCDTSVLKIPMKFEGGDSLNYHWQAYSVLSSKSWQKTNSGKLKLKDILFHIPKVTITASQKLAIVLDDQCTNKKDTAYVNIILLKPEKLATKFKDTTLCIGNTISWKAKPVYGLTKNSVWEWHDVTNDKLLSSNDSLSLTASKTTKIKLILTNGCTIDSNVFTLNVNPPLKANILTGKGNLNDTSLCLGQSLKLFTKGNGGAGKGYNYTWKANGNVVSGKDSFLFKPILTSNFILTLILNDNCTAGADSISKTIKVVESPKANFTYGVACSRTNMDFKFTGSKPLSPVTTAFKWNFNNQDSSSNENPSYLFSTPGSKTLTLTLVSNNGCKNEITKQVVVKVQSKADFDLKDICENDSAIFINKSQDATDYKWDFGDGSTGNLQSIKHKYSINGNPKTFDVKLVAIVKDGCSDSLTKSISVFESPKADFSTGLLCNLTTTDFKFTGTIPKSPVTTAIHWNFNNEDTSFLENPSHLFSTSGNKTLTLILTSNNGCTDTLIKTIEIKPKSKADFTANDVCETDSVVFINKSKDATGSTWKFGDGKNSSLENPKHKYSITTSTTFNVTQVAVVSGGCSDSIVKPVTINENPKSDFTYTNNGGKVDFKATQTGAKNYRWLFGNGDSAKVSNPDFSYTYKKSALYNVCLKVNNTAGCQSETCQQISITAGISPMARPSGFKIYPNPNTGNFTVEIENPSNDVSIEIYDLLGNLIKKIETSPDTKSYFIEMSVAKGIYLVKVGNAGMIYNQKVMVSFNKKPGDN